MGRAAIALLLMTISQPGWSADWVFRLTDSSTLQVTQQGDMVKFRPETLVQHQAPGSPLFVQVMATGSGRCENGVLKGSGALESIQIPFVQIINGVAQASRHVSCGEMVVFDASSQTQLSGIKAITNAVKQIDSRIPAALQGVRVQIGTVNFFGAEGLSASSNIYLDMTGVQSDVATLDAKFASPAVSFGEVNNTGETKSSVRLDVTKTRDAGAEAIPYNLTFESTQVRDNSFQLKTLNGESYVPYKIKMGDVTIVPGAIYARTIASGTLTSDSIMLDFYLQGKSIKGLYAGMRLTDTLTAVITPTS